MNDVKVEALDALTSNVLSTPAPPAEFAMDEDPAEWEVPKVSSTDDFELAKAVKEKNRPTGRYEKLEGTAQLKSVVANWEPVFIQFKDPNGEWFVWCLPSSATALRVTCNSCYEPLISFGVLETQADCCRSRSRYRQYSPKKRKILPYPPHAKANGRPIRLSSKIQSPHTVLAITLHFLKSCAVSLPRCIVYWST